MNCRILASLTWSTFPRYISGLEWGFFIRMSRKNGLEAARTPLWASNWWPSPDTRVTSGKSICSQSFNRVCGELPWLSVDWIEIILFNNQTQSGAVGIWIIMLLGDLLPLTPPTHFVTECATFDLSFFGTMQSCRRHMWNGHFQWFWVHKMETPETIYGDHFCRELSANLVDWTPVLSELLYIKFTSKFTQ